jgi:hypothetical protein
MGATTDSTSYKSCQNDTNHTLNKESFHLDIMLLLGCSCLGRPDKDRRMPHTFFVLIGPVRIFETTEVSMETQCHMGLRGNWPYLVRSSASPLVASFYVSNIS